MTVKNIQTTEKSSRLFFVDHLRVFMAILVVLHHVALVYGASLDGYYYVEPPFTSPSAFVTLLVFVMVNQSWFMGAFFLLAGYFAPGSYDRKGPGAFIKDKFLRYGIPIALFYFILSPISFIGYYLMPAELTGITSSLTWSAFWNTYPNFLGIGPLWFVAMLLIFSLGYAVWRMVTKNRSAAPQKKSSVPSYLGIGIFILGLTAVSYLMRMVIPMGKAVSQFPTLAYLPQYLSFFVVGIVASRRDWFRTIPGSMGFAGFVIAAAAAIFLFPLAFSGQMFSLVLGPALYNSMGNGHWQSAVYALWDSTFAVCLTVGLIVLFRRLFNRESRLGRFLSEQSYAVYITHIPIVVFGAYLLRSIPLESLPKFGLVSIILIPVCFSVAYLIREIPFVARII